jgi:hypothetical protein
MSPRVYIETSVVSYLTARPSRDVMTLARQQYTVAWWALQGQAFDAWISPLVIKEASRGDPVAANLRFQLCKTLPNLDLNDQANNIAHQLIARGAIPGTEPEDALHMGIAVTNQVDYIASWNFVHLVGATAKLKLRQHIIDLGYKPPVIATPEELLEEMS